MQPRRIGTVGTGLALVGGLLIAGEVMAIANGFGPFFSVVSAGYFMAAGAGYLVYRRIQTERAEPAAQIEAMAEAPPAAVVPPEPVESRAVARHSDLLQGLPDESVAAVLALARWTSAPAGCRLAEAGTEGDNVYIIVDGHVQLTGHSDVGEVTVRIAEEGESFPLAALLGSGTLVTSATAMTDLLAYAIPRKHLIALCADRPDIGMTLYAQVAEILGDRYRSTLARHMTGVGNAVRQPEIWANV